MAASTTPLLTALLKRATLDDDDELLKASNAALKKNKSDIGAQHVKVVALLKLERYQEAARFVQEEGRERLKADAPLECAYALYKVGRFEDAADLAATSTSRGAQHLQAQSRYRLEDPAKAQQLYRAISSKPVVDEEADLRINHGALDALSQWLGLVDADQARRPGREDLEVFETAYNAACASIARGELKQAEILLKRAKALCKYSESLTEQEKAEELLPIATQELYVLQSMGRQADAAAIADEIAVDAITDLATRTIAQTNKLNCPSSSSSSSSSSSTTTTANPFLIHKALNSAPAIPLNDKLFSYQTIRFLHNRKAADLQAMKFDGLIRSAAEEHSKLDPTSAEAYLSSVFGAAALARNQLNKAAIKQVLPELEKRPNDVGLLMTLAQMYVLLGKTASAADLVGAFLRRLDQASSDADKELRFNPGLVSLAVALYHTQGRKGQIKQELAKAASYWRHRPTAPASLLCAAGSNLLQSGDDEDSKEAADIFSKLKEQQQAADKATIAGFIASQAAQGRADDSLPDVETLTPVDQLVADIDVDALEHDGIPRSSNAAAIAHLAGSRKRKAADGSAAKPKRVRKSRLPKDYDPSKTPDPERWLPMKDRSYYKPPKGKKKKNGNKGKRDGGTQGGVVNEDLDINAKPVAAEGGGGGAGGGGGKKKKGKGKK